MDDARFRLRPDDVATALAPVLAARPEPDAAESPVC
jgi:hypothetical protein